MENKRISLKKIAADLGIHRITAMRYVRKIGIEPELKRCTDSLGHACLSVDNEQYKYILERRSDDGYGDIDQTTVVDSRGYFYIICIMLCNNIFLSCRNKYIYI